MHCNVRWVQKLQVLLVWSIFSISGKRPHKRENIYSEAFSVIYHFLVATDFKVFMLKLINRVQCFQSSRGGLLQWQQYHTGGGLLVQAGSDRKERSLLKLIISATIHTPQEMVSTDWFNNILKSHNSLWLNASDSRHKSNCGGIRWHLNGSRGYRWLWSLDRGRMGKGKMI